MTLVVKPMQHLFLWRLAVGGGDEFLADLPNLTPASQRTQMVQAGLIVESKRPKPNKAKPGAKPKKPVQVKFCSLTEQGWAWCQANMHWPAKSKSPKAGQVLELLLPRLRLLWQRGEVVASLDELVRKTAADSSPASERVVEPVPVAPPRPMDVHQAIRDACRSLGGGREAVRIRLADLRRQLNGVEQRKVTQALLDLAEKEELSLYRLDDPREIDEADRDAAVRTSTGEEKHILYFGGIRS